MASMCRLASIAAVGLAHAWGDSNQDIIMPPIYEGDDLPERLLLFIPGALVPTENYRPTMEAVQKATTDVRLTVVIPAMTGKMCIFQCTSKAQCGPLKNTVDAVVKKSGFQGGNKETFVGGHSLGTVCANNMVAGSGFDYAGVLAYGGYVDETGDSSLLNYTIPVLTMAGELDGGSARPGRLSVFYEQFKTYAEMSGTDQALTQKPVHTLHGMDHSDFCPGFFVTAIKDLKSEVSQDVALEAIGRGSSAFLHLNSPTSAATKAAAMGTMHELLGFTDVVLSPYLQAFTMEQSSWCETAQKATAGLADAEEQKLMIKSWPVEFSEFEHAHTNASLLPSGDLELNVISSVEHFTGPTNNHGAAKSVDCKMVSSDKIAQELSVETHNVSCSEVNKLAVDAARSMMPAHALKRFDAQGRKFCYKEDHGVLGNVGPLFVKGSINTTETSECLEISSLKLLTGVKSVIFPGNHYCKLFSPALAMEWMMTDGLKPFPYNLTGDDDMNVVVV